MSVFDWCKMIKVKPQNSPRVRTGNQPYRIAYGAGNALLGLLAETPGLFDCVVDDTPGYAGQKIAGLQIYDSKFLSEISPAKMEIVICAQTSSASTAIAEKLRRLGFTEGRDFGDCSQIQIDRMTKRLERFMSRRQHQLPGTLVAKAVKETGLRNLSGIAGTWLFATLAEYAEFQQISGAVAECGVYQGANAVAALHCSPALRKRRYCLFDSFEGLTSAGGLDPASRAGEFADVSIRDLERRVVNFKHCELHPGYFDKVLPKLPEDQWAIVYLDCDFALPAGFCASYFWERMPDRALMLVHDYWYPTVELPADFIKPFAGVKVVMDDFLADKKHAAIVFPESSHLLVQKFVDS